MAPVILTKRDRVMKHMLFVLLLLAVGTANADEPGFVPLFNGTDLPVGR